MMSFLRPASRQSLRPAFQYRAVVRPFSSAQPLRLKEDKPQDPEELDRVKNEQIEKQKKGEGHWHEELASSSESTIAADKEQPADHEQHMQDLQKQTAGQSEKDHPEGKAGH